MSKKTRKQQNLPVSSESFEQRLKRHPELKPHFETLLGVVENRDGTLQKADDAELEVLKAVRQLGRQTLQEWGQQQAERKAEEMPRLNPAACKDKKNSELA
jgi:hypothetical protein